MSSRALRKAQREREEQEKANQLQEENEQSEDGAAIPVKKSAFAMLEDNEDAEANEDEAAEDGEEDGGVGVEEEAATSSIPKPSGKKKKKKKKAKVVSPGDQVAPEKGEQLDEIDKALKQLSTDGHASAAGTTAAGADSSLDETARLLAIDTNHLHAQNEMRRLFGRAALERQDEDEAPQNQNVGGNRRQQRRVNQAGLAQALRRQGGANGRAGGLASIALRRNIFIQGKEEWPVATGGGLGMEIGEKRADGTVLYRFVHNRVYQDVQAQFNIAVESMDPNRLVVLLQHNPYHISTLLQVSEIAKQDRDLSTAGDLLERALFSFGRAVHSTFAKNIAEGKARLDFSRPENREFWLASWRYMQNLSMRATWRTVYEWAKLLLSLSPEDDPYAMWLVMDQYALRSRQDLDFLNLSRNAAFKDAHGNMPSIQLSQGLAEWRAGNKSKGKQAFFTAIGRFPWAVSKLMHELGLDPPPAVWGKEPTTEKERLYTDLYATRAKDLWNTPETSALLLEVASAVPPDTIPTQLTSEITVNEARHVLLSDTPALIALIPRKFTAQLFSSSDPLPPSNNQPSYTLTHAPASSRPSVTAANREDTLRELHTLYGFFSNLFPWFRPTGGAENEAPEQPSEAAVQERIRESGVDERVLVERTQRMVELQDRLMADEDAGLGEMVAGALGGREAMQDIGGDPAEGEGEGEVGRRARVEDAADAGD